MPEIHTKVVILIAECAFEQKLIALIEQAGAVGYWAEKVDREGEGARALAPVHSNAS